MHLKITFSLNNTRITIKKRSDNSHFQILCTYYLEAALSMANDTTKEVHIYVQTDICGSVRLLKSITEKKLPEKSGVTITITQLQQQLSHWEQSSTSHRKWKSTADSFQYLLYDHHNYTHCRSHYHPLKPFKSAQYLNDRTHTHLNQQSCQPEAETLTTRPDSWLTKQILGWASHNNRAVY
jgi:hypothetical protein